MIKRLEISNYVLINHLIIEFGPKLNVLTGETGAGKSIILGALGLIRGRRADTKTLKDKQNKCVVEATVILANEWKSFFADNDLDFYEETIIRREILPSSKSRVFINDTPVKLNLLQEIGDGILSIQQQFDHSQIADPDHQIQLLDWYGGHEKDLLDYQSSFETYQDLLREVQDLTKKLDLSRKDSQLNEFLLAELDELNLTENDKVLHEELNLLENAENLSLQFRKFNFEISENESSILDQLRDLARAFGEIAVEEKSVQEFQQQLHSVIVELEELTSNANRIEDNLEYNESEVQEKRERLDKINELQRKHQQNDIDGLFNKWEELSSFSSGFEELQNRLEHAKIALDKQTAVLEEKANVLTNRRRATIEKFTADWKKILAELAMPNIRIEGVLELLNTFGPTGKDMLQLMIAVNKGSELQLISDVASGGEISRMALAVHSMISDKMKTPTLVFDEIDTGVSGEVSSRMGTLLQSMSNHRQILCITHSPQIAAKGDLQWKVFKKDLEDATISEIILLDEQGRIDEIAGMLSGMETTEAARQNALVLLENR